jgi:acetylornithine deacetylase
MSRVSLYCLDTVWDVSNPGLGFETMIANYGTDCPNLKGDHASYLYGPGSIFVAHGDDEALRVSDLEDAVEGFKKLVRHALSS